MYALDMKRAHATAYRKVNLHAAMQIRGRPFVTNATLHPPMCKTETKMTPLTATNKTVYRAAFRCPYAFRKGKSLL